MLNVTGIVTLNCEMYTVLDDTRNIEI